MFIIEVKRMGRFSVMANAGNIKEAFREAERFLLKGYQSVRVICPDGRIVTL